MTAERMCAVCRKRRGKSELLRIAKGADGKASIDESGKLPGRGMYICKDGGCLKNAEKRKVLERFLKTSDNGAVYCALNGIGMETDGKEYE